MPKVAKPFTAREVEALSTPGLHADGEGLYLRVRPDGGKSWVLRFVFGERRRDLGLGTFPDVPLTKARTLAREARQQVLDGRDPIEERKAADEALKAAQKRIPTFGEVADALIGAKRPAWRSKKHAWQWENTLSKHAAKLRPMPVDRIAVADVIETLKPHWEKTPETASRLRGRIEAVLDSAKVQGYRTGENPAAWRGNLKHLLSKRRKLYRGHHPALPFKDVPSFVAALRERGGVVSDAVEFAILTAARSGEVRGAAWAEVDFAARTWTVPGARMKAGKSHAVPLSTRAVAILEARAAFRDPTEGDGALIFPGAKKGRPLSDMSLSMAVRRMNPKVTPHGFRSSFRDWCGDAAGVPREIAEACLAHTIGNAVEAAYRRSDGLERRRVVMEQWAAFIEPKQGNVVAFGNWRNY